VTTELNVYGRELSDDELRAGVHRDFVGGLWDEVGELQARFLRSAGLRADSRLLDLGCGCLRGGVHFIRFLDRGNYYGLDINASLVRAGLEIELPREGLADRLPPSCVLVNGAFEAWRFGVEFEYALALSLFTHLPAGDLRRCLIELTKCMRPGGHFFVSYFDCPAGDLVPAIHRPVSGLTTYSERDPYHLRVEDLERCAEKLPWTLISYGEWGHPREQQMVRFDRV
jgi:SAM-dependent methyltransferase